MSVTKSPEWKWLRGTILRDADGAAFVVMRATDSELLVSFVSSYIDSDTAPEWITIGGHMPQPDLDDPATQGAIVFGIFGPLGISINRIGGAHVQPGLRWAVVVHYGSEGQKRLRGKLDGEEIGVSDSLPELIVAVFAALDSKPQDT